MFIMWVFLELVYNVTLWSWILTPFFNNTSFSSHVSMNFHHFLSLMVSYTLSVWRYDSMKIGSLLCGFFMVFYTFIFACYTNQTLSSFFFHYPHTHSIFFLRWWCHCCLLDLSYCDVMLTGFVLCSLSFWFLLVQSSVIHFTKLTCLHVHRKVCVFLNGLDMILFRVILVLGGTMMHKYTTFTWFILPWCHYHPLEWLFDDLYHLHVVTSIMIHHCLKLILVYRFQLGVLLHFVVESSYAFKLFSFLHSMVLWVLIYVSAKGIEDLIMGSIKY